MLSRFNPEHFFHRCDAQGACQVIDNKLRPYHALIDTRSEEAINNYADGALLLVSSSGKNGYFVSIFLKL